MVIHANEGAITRVEWRQNLIAWMNDRGGGTFLKEGARCPCVPAWGSWEGAPQIYILFLKVILTCLFVSNLSLSI